MTESAGPSRRTGRRLRSRHFWAYGAVVLVVIGSMALSVPSAMTAWSARQAGEVAAEATQLSRLATASGTLLRAVQVERGSGAVFLNGNRYAPQAVLVEAREATDLAARSWLSAAAAVPDPAAAPLIDRVRSGLAAIAHERLEVSARNGPHDRHFVWYSDLAEAVIRVAAQTLGQVEQAEVGQIRHGRSASEPAQVGIATVYVSLLVATEQLGRERGKIAGRLMNWSADDGQATAELTVHRAARIQALDIFRLLSPPADARRLAEIEALPEARYVAALEQSILNGDAERIAAVPADVWFDQVSALLDQYNLLVEEQNAALERVAERFAANTRSVARQAGATAAGVLLVGLLLGLGLLAAARRRIRAETRDATEQAEKDAARIDAILSTAGDAILTVVQGGAIERANAATEQLFGYSPDELIGSSVFRLSGNPEAAQLEGQMDAYLNAAEERFIGTPRESIGVRKDGTMIPVEVLITRRTVDGQNIYTLVIRDISERRAAMESLTLRDQELSERNEALARSNAELQQFAYVASHDLQEPLRKVTSYMDVLEADYGDQLDEQARQYMGFASDAARRMRELINDLLALSRLREETMKVGRCDTRAVVDAIIDDFEVALQEAGAVVEVGDLPVLAGDRAHLHQVFQNLLSNSVKYRGAAPLRIDISARAEPDGWHFVIRDNGIGFRQEYAEQIFLMFQRLVSRRDYEGTGIGLAIVTKVITNHGGRIWATSEPGVGTTVEFVLPAVDEEAEPTVRIPRQRRGSPVEAVAHR